MKREYTSALWATYQQWREVGVQVRKGEKSTAIVFWKLCGETEEAEADTREPDDSDNRRCFARAYHVFNAAQVDGVEVPQLTALPELRESGTRRRFSPIQAFALSKVVREPTTYLSLTISIFRRFQRSKKAGLLLLCARA